MKKGKRSRPGPANPVVKTTAAAPPHRPRRSRVVLYAASSLLLISAAFGVRYWLMGPDIPVPPPDKLDQRLAEEIENARAIIWEAPRQPERWGDLGMLLAAHSF